MWEGDLSFGSGRSTEVDIWEFGIVEQFSNDLILYSSGFVNAQQVEHLDAIVHTYMEMIVSGSDREIQAYELGETQFDLQVDVLDKGDREQSKHKSTVVDVEPRVLETIAVALYDDGLLSPRIVLSTKTAGRLPNGWREMKLEDEEAELLREIERINPGLGGEFRMYLCRV